MFTVKFFYRYCMFENSHKKMLGKNLEKKKVIECVVPSSPASGGGWLVVKKVSPAVWHYVMGHGDFC